MKRFAKILIAVVLMIAMLFSTASALTVEQALEFLEIYYLKEIPDEVYEVKDLDELFGLLGDPYTYYMSEEEYRGFVSSVEGTVDLVGIGVSIQYTREGILILEALKGGPAEEAGIQGGDLIIAVDGVSCVPAEESHRSMILGEEGTEVVVTVLRNGTTMDITLKRAPVVIPNTEAEVLDGHIGYISCISFGSDTGELFRTHVEGLDDTVDCWLVDMRNNSGGYTDAAVNALGVFVGPGQHLFLQTAQGYLYFYGYEQEPSTQKPAVVLVNEYSASAAEAFAAGMRDHRAGMIVGSRTFGKGTAQVVFDNETNPELFGDDALKVTAYRFYSGSGITNDSVGVIPTLLVSDEYAYDVAMAICGSEVDVPENTLRLVVSGWDVSLDHTAMSREALGALLEALYPNAALYLYEGGEELRCSVDAVAQKLGVSYESRWFTDVENSRFANAINTLATYEVLPRGEDGLFRPGEELTRGEACAMLGSALRLEGSSAAHFDDLTADDPCTPYVNALAELGLVFGRGDGRFCPDERLNQQEFFALLSRVARYLNISFDFAVEEDWEQRVETAAKLGFAQWARESVALLNNMNALNTSDGRLIPSAPILREEAAANLCSVLMETGILPE